MEDYNAYLDPNYTFYFDEVRGDYILPGEEDPSTTWNPDTKRYEAPVVATAGEDAALGDAPYGYHKDGTPRKHPKKKPPAGPLGPEAVDEGSFFATGGFGQAVDDQDWEDAAGFESTVAWSRFTRTTLRGTAAAPTLVVPLSTKHKR